MSIWHDNYDAKEVFRSRQERWNEKDPSASVVLQVAQADLYPMVNAMLGDRTAWPYNDVSRFELNVSDIEILPITTKYVADRGVDESITTGQTRAIRVMYKPNTSFQHTIVTTVGTGTATDYGYETQTVWVDVTRLFDTQFLTQDWLDFQWGADDPIKPEEAPGRVYRSVKYDVFFRNVYLTSDLEWIIYNYSNTVNNSILTAAYGLISYQADQVLFNVEDVKPSLKFDRSTLGETPLPAAQTLHNLRVSFHGQQGDATWNKFWRPKVDATGTTDDSGWYEMYFKQTVDNQAADVPYEPFQSTNFWYPLWV